MAKDTYQDRQPVRYMLKCQKCTQTSLLDEVFAPIPKHPASSSGPYKLCPGSGKPGILVETIPKG